MRVYKNIIILLSTFCYMFRRLLRHLQGELYRIHYKLLTSCLIADLKLYYTRVIYSLRYNEKNYAS